jgi:hypothetical protein
MPTPKRKVCAFCQRDDQKITKEHVVPKWILNYLPKNVETSLFNPTDNLIASWKLSNTGLVVNCVCKNCNHGWMEQTEKFARPLLEPMIIHGTKTKLANDELKLLTTWIYKTTMVIDLVRPNQSACYFTPIERKQFSEFKPMPARELFIWLASFRTPDITYVLKQLTLVPNEKIRPLVKDNQIYVVTVGIGKMAFQVFTFRVEHFRPGIKHSFPNWGNAAIRISPPPLIDFSWPPPKSLDEHGFNLFHSRWIG